MYTYLITDPKFYTDDDGSFEKKLTAVLQQHTPDFVLFRDKSTLHYDLQAKCFLETCLQFPKAKPLLHGDVALAKSLGAYGVHLTSLQFEEIQTAKMSGLFVVISCHTEAEVLCAEKSGADAVTYSPIFSTPNKGEPKGLAELQRMVDKISLPIIALGGITTSEQVKAVEETGCFGFASIRYFVEN